MTIYTKYLPPTNTKGPRIKAYSAGDQVTIPYPGWTDTAHDEAFRAFQRKYEWAASGNWIAGELPDRRGCCYVRIQERLILHPETGE